MSLPEKTSSYINALPSDYTEIGKFVKSFVDEVRAGYVSPIIVMTQLKAIEELIKILRANPELRDILMDEVDKYPDKSFDVNGSKFEKAETGVRYDFSKCGSTVLNSLYQQKQELDKKIKDQETFLKNLGNNPAFDPETGEQLLQPIRTSNSYVKITLKK